MFGSAMEMIGINLKNKQKPGLPVGVSSDDTQDDTSGYAGTDDSSSDATSGYAGVDDNSSSDGTEGYAE